MFMLINLERKKDVNMSANAAFDRKYSCINCGKEVKNLFKRYSATVLKLTDCESCKNVADKYVEYDLVIIMIDLVLLQKRAYRHILFNVEFKNFWKLSVLLLLVETYSEWTRNNSTILQKTQDESFLNEFNVEVADFHFYKICLSLATKTSCFLIVLYWTTWTYCKIVKQPLISFKNIWKTLTVSSFGIFLLLPSLIWDTALQDFHLSMVALYTVMCQLLAYTVLCNVPKIWTIIAIFSAYYCKSFFFDFFELMYIVVKTYYFN